jgi:ATP-dependent Lon protease
MRCGIETIIIPWKNQKDLLDIPKEYREKVNFIPVKSLDEVLNIALVDWEPRNKEPLVEKAHSKRIPHSKAA